MSNVSNAMTGIVIVNFNTTDELFACLDSIDEQVKAPHRVYVVENGSRPEVQAEVLERCARRAGVEVLALEGNLGYSGGNNAGVRKALADGARYIAIVNSDIVFVNDAISIMVDDLEGDVAVVGPRVETADGRNGQYLLSTYSYAAAFFDRQPFHYFRRLLSRLRHESFDVDAPKVFHGMVSGCCFLIDGEAFERMGLFDDNVFLYSEERILSIKLESAGLKACYEPKARVLHLEGQTTGAIGSPFADFHRYASDYYTVSRYCNPNAAQRIAFKALRLAAFRAKAAKDDGHKRYYALLKKELRSIDRGSYKIHPNV